MDIKTTISTGEILVGFFKCPQGHYFVGEAKTEKVRVSDGLAQDGFAELAADAPEGTEREPIMVEVFHDEDQLQPAPCRESGCKESAECKDSKYETFSYSA